MKTNRILSIPFTEKQWSQISDGIKNVNGLCFISDKHVERLFRNIIIEYASFTRVPSEKKWIPYDEYWARKIQKKDEDDRSYTEIIEKLVLKTLKSSKKRLDRYDIIDTVIWSYIEHEKDQIERNHPWQMRRLVPFLQSRYTLACFICEKLSSFVKDRLINCTAGYYYIKPKRDVTVNHLITEFI